MKKTFSILLIGILWVSCISAAAAEGHLNTGENHYTLSLKEAISLQSIPDREIQAQAYGLPRETIPGESPTTGQPWEGTYLPMLAQISNPIGRVKVNGKNIETSGVGENAPWAMQFADIVYEGLLYRSGETRMSVLLSDSFASGELVGGIGPIRSARVGHFALREEWQSGFVYAGGPHKSESSMSELLTQTGADAKGVFFNLIGFDFQDLKRRVKGAPIPDNFNADVVGMRSLIPPDYAADPRPFLFANETPYGEGYDAAGSIHLDWGKKSSISHFVYDEEARSYLRFCGDTMDAKNWVPYRTFAAADDRDEKSKVQMTFSNVIIQRTAYDFTGNNPMMPNLQSTGKGNADIFIAGRYIPGYWIRNTMDEPTVFYDDQGNELRLARGKTFIAHFPPDALCGYESR